MQNYTVYSIVLSYIICYSNLHTNLVFLLHLQMYLQHFNVSTLCLCLASSALSVAVGIVLRIVWLCSSNLPKGQITHCILVWNVRTLIVLNNLSVYLKD